MVWDSAVRGNFFYKHNLQLSLNFCRTVQLLGFGGYHVKVNLGQKVKVQN